MKLELTEGELQVMAYIVESLVRGRPDVRQVMKHPEFAPWARKVKALKEAEKLRKEQLENLRKATSNFLSEGE